MCYDGVRHSVVVTKRNIPSWWIGQQCSDRGFTYLSVHFNPKKGASASESVTCESAEGGGTVLQSLHLMPELQPIRALTQAIAQVTHHQHLSRAGILASIS